MSHDAMKLDSNLLNIVILSKQMTTMNVGTELVYNKLATNLSLYALDILTVHFEHENGWLFSCPTMAELLSFHLAGSHAE